MDGCTYHYIWCCQDKLDVYINMRIYIYDYMQRYHFVWGDNSDVGSVVLCYMCILLTIQHPYIDMIYYMIDP